MKAKSKPKKLGSTTIDGLNQAIGVTDNPLPEPLQECTEINWSVSQYPKGTALEGGIPD